MCALRTMNLDNNRRVFVSSSSDNVRMEALDKLFIREVYGSSVLRLSDFTKTLHNGMYSLHTCGTLKGYAFLFEMPYEESVRWVRKAIVDIQQLNEFMPGEWPPAGIQESLDHLRRYRKSRRPSH